jgi:hypothetical protein
MKQAMRARSVCAGIGAVLVVSLCLACEGQVQVSSGPSGPTVQETVGEVTGLDHPEVDLPPSSRGVKRLTVDQLRASVGILGGSAANGKSVQWTIEYQGKTYNALDDGILGFTLGKPDYIQITEEITEPNALYLKFMDDMARYVCDEMMSADDLKPQPQRALTRFVVEPEDLEDGPAIDENLRYLALRFLAERIPADAPDDPRLVDLKALFIAGSQAADGAPSGAMGWMTVCVGMLTSPEFHLY